MTSRWQVVLRLAAAAGVGAGTMASLGCEPSPGAREPVAAGVDAVLECAASDIHHVFRIREAARAVEDLSFSPAKLGVADVTPAEYRLQFDEPRDHYALLVQVNRTTWTGTRQLFDDEQQAIKGHGGTDDLVCTQRAAAK